MAAADTKLILSIQARGLRVMDTFSKSDPMCVLYKKCGVRGDWEEVGRTESLANTGDPQWQTSFTLDYYFHQKQSLRFSVFDVDDNSGQLSGQDSLGTAECRLGQVLAAPGHQLEVPLSPYRHLPGDCGLLLVRAEELVDGARDRVTLDLTAQSLDKKDLFSESDPFYIVYRKNPNSSETLVYRSEWILNTASPDWLPVTLDCAKLCLGDWQATLRIEVYDWDADGGHDFIGDCTTTLEELAQGEGFQILQFDLMNKKKQDKKGYKNSGQIVVKSVKIEQDSSFLDYVRGGLKINLAVAVDLTASSAHLHRLKNGENTFTTAIRTIGEILQDYDYDKRILGLGFGARPAGQGVTDSLPLGGTAGHYCQGVEGLVQAYRHTLDSVEMCEPTNYSSALRYVVDDAARRGREVEYSVIMIITDGGLSDMAETKAALVALSRLPVSVVLVGVGEADMGAMVQLDSDKARLHSGAEQAQRDIVQFVHLNSFLPRGSLDPSEFSHELEAPKARLALARAVLQEIPRQVTEYMRASGIPPRVPDIPSFDIPPSLEEDFDKRFNMNN